VLPFEDVDYREQVEDWDFVDESSSLYRWESEDRYSLEIYEDEDDGFVVDYVDEAEICSALMWDWNFEEPEEAFHYAQDFMEFFDESEYSEF
jgi:hypothetical protein